jgi:integrase
MSVKLRNKKLKNGMRSLYLDIYVKGKRSFEFLNIHIPDTKRLSPDDRAKMELAEQTRTQREYSLILDTSGAGLPKNKAKSPDFLGYFESIRSTKTHLNNWNNTAKWLKEFTKGQPVLFASVDLKWLLEFQAFVLCHVANNTAFQYMWVLRYTLSKAEREGIIEATPFRRMRKEDKLRWEKSLPKYLTLEEVRKLANCETEVTQELRDAFLFACFCGLRWSDISRLTWNKVKEGAGRGGADEWAVELEVKKTRSQMNIPLPAQAVEILRRRKAGGVAWDAPVFPWCAANPDEKARNNAANLMLKTWAKDAGLGKPVNFHMARHTFATLTLTHGADLYTVSKLLGHSDIKTTVIYAKVVDERKRQAVANLPRLDI